MQHMIVWNGSASGMMIYLCHNAMHLDRHAFLALCTMMGDFIVFDAAPDFFMIL